MKKMFLIIITLLAGIAIGISISFWLFEKHSEVQALNNIAEIEALTFNIYEKGDPESSVIALEHLIKILEFCKDDKSHKDICNTDRGLAHARLFMIYKKIGNKDLAEKEYRNAIPLLGETHKISSQKELSEIVNKIDAIKK
jgi:hypothetical protein